MPFLKITLRVLGMLALLTGITGIADADERTALIDSYRMRQAELGQKIAFNTEKIEIMQDLLDQGRTYAVAFPVDDGIQTMLATRQEAVKVQKTIILMQAILGHRVLSADELHEDIVEGDKTATNIAIAFRQDIPRLTQLNKKLQDEWRTLEASIAEMTQSASSDASDSSQTAATDTRVCVQLAETRTSKTPLSAGASTSPRASVHTVSHRGKVGSKPIDVTLSWSAPPLRLCEGDEFYVEVTATNGAPTSSGLSLNYVGSVSVSGIREHIETVTCSNPVTWVSVANDVAAVAPDMSSYINSCTYKVVSLPKTTDPKVLITAEFGIHTGGAGQVLYSYAAP